MEQWIQFRLELFIVSMHVIGHFKFPFSHDDMCFSCFLHLICLSVHTVLYFAFLYRLRDLCDPCRNRYSLLENVGFSPKNLSVLKFIKSSHWKICFVFKRWSLSEQHKLRYKKHFLSKKNKDRKFYHLGTYFAMLNYGMAGPYTYFSPQNKQWPGEPLREVIPDNLKVHGNWFFW